MRPLREAQCVLTLFFFTELLIYAVALRFATFSVLENLPGLDYTLLQRDRLGCVLVFGLSAMLLGCYDMRRITDRFDSVYYIFLAVGLTVLLELAMATLMPPETRVISRREIVFSVPVALLLLFVWRSWAAGFAARFRSLHRHFYVIGSDANGNRIAQAISADTSLHAEAEFISYAELRARTAARPHGRDRLFTVPEDVIIEVEDGQRGALTGMLTFCQENFQRVFLYPSLDDLLLFDHGKVLAVAGIPLVEVSGARQAYPYGYVKRSMDILIAAGGLLLAAPLCLVTAILIKLTSPGPVLYVQERLGLGGRPFRIYKFRTMRSEMQLRDATGHVLAQENDPRITPLGRFLRKHRIDEIPQLINVLKGDMSLIGPRPVWQEYYDTNRESLPLVDLRLLVRPGLTSLSHILGSYTSEPRDRLRYDLVYISTLSFLNDIRILFETVRIVLSGRGAQ